jgi:hypothetical protein
MEGERRRPITSERATLDPFEALAGEVRPREQRDLMERPFFSLAKAKRVTPILYQNGDTQVQVYATVLPVHAVSASDRRRARHRQPRIPAPQRCAQAPAGDRRPHHHPSRRALASPAVLLGQ